MSMTKIKCDNHLFSNAYIYILSINQININSQEAESIIVFSRSQKIKLSSYKQIIGAFRRIFIYVYYS